MDSRSKNTITSELSSRPTSKVAVGLLRLERLLDLWESFSPASREKLLSYAEDLGDRPSTRRTRVFMARAAPSKEKHCPTCHVQVLPPGTNYCAQCGSMLPVFDWG